MSPKAAYRTSLACPVAQKHGLKGLQKASTAFNLPKNGLFDRTVQFKATYLRPCRHLAGRNREESV